ncbi:MAG: phospholipase D-like domain-containing protein [Saprospiraceae bacterium]
MIYKIIFLLSFSIFFLHSTHGQIATIGIENDYIEFALDTSYGQIVEIGCVSHEFSWKKSGSNNLITVYSNEPSELLEVCILTEKDQLLSYYETTGITKSISSGEMQVYFNLSVDTTFRKSSFKPSGTNFGEVQIALRNLIRNAKTSIDFAAYNTNEVFIVNELIDAHNRGVRVRVITDDETTNSGWNGGVPFYIVYGNIGSGLMHNKFIIVDADESMDSYVVTGSMNFTTNQMRNDPNHLIFIQDQSLAKAYTMEFEEMWGSPQAIPNLSIAKFGNQKTQNTPTQFNIGGIPVELYFSPSDKTTSKIISVLEKATTEQLLALMIFTNWELRDKIASNLQKGVKTRWIVEDTSNSSSVIQAVRSNQGEVLFHTHPDIFHHKYAIIDENTQSPILITGSHNWTFSAETVNDENTLIIHDGRIVNIFRQEFEARWKELNTTSQTLIQDEIWPLFYPNPSEGQINFNVKVESLQIFDKRGRKILEVNIEDKTTIQMLPPDIYILRIFDASGNVHIGKWVKL